MYSSGRGLFCRLQNGPGARRAYDSSHMSASDARSDHHNTNDGSLSRYPMNKHFLAVAAATFILLPWSSHAADLARQADVAGRGADVMPFDLKATTHVFTKTAHGGVQRVVAKSATD